ncbi:Ig-like domain-containing protein [Desulforamulus aquiferis]|uniref:Ig-like domain-containing protein n=1 Tax=Desulforamulus aquiferis TaxID=1397668 RepID=A0AAW7ZBR0_9FIRM|nr:Ig-like domain-containing protein [Desulforamulus aquiferis]MDO7787114.1 Ig-like domain-containing protein [Desulforamulus aquiferis]
MAVNTVRVLINGAWVTLTKNQSTGKYEGTVAAPNVTSWNVNVGHYYPVTVEATDLAGNVTTADDTHATLGGMLKLTVKEVTKPTISITAPAASAFLSTNTPAISLQLRDEANGSGVKISSLQLKIDGGAAIGNTAAGMSVTAVSGGYNCTYTPQIPLSDGSHTITVTVQDNDGNTSTTASRTFTVDTVPPSLNITSPADNIWQNTTSLVVSGSTNDATSSPVTVTIKLNDTDQGAVTVEANGNFSKALTLVEGTNTIVVIATDRAGKSSSVTRTVNVDMTAPVVTNVTITPNPVNVGQSYTITVEVTDI